MRRLFLPLALLAAGCADAPRGPAGAEIVDSAGVRLVQLAPMEDWHAVAETTELLRIGTLDGPPESVFSGIAAGRILQNGTMVLADAQTLEVRQFTKDGEHLRTHGGRGDGPVEYQFIRGIDACAPSGFTVFDAAWQMSFYDGNGEFLEKRATRLEGESPPYQLVCEPSGRVAALNWDLDGLAEPGFQRLNARLRVLDSDGSELVDYGTRLGSERFGLGERGSMPHPAGRSILIGFMGENLLVADGSFFGFERWDLSGNLVEIVRFNVPAPDPDSIMAEYSEWMLSRATRDEQRQRLRQQIAEIAESNPEQGSFLSSMRTTGDRILLREVTVGESGRWFAFTSTGEPLGYLPIPDGAKLLDFRIGQLLVEERDDLGVPSAVLYSVAPRGGI